VLPKKEFDRVVKESGGDLRLVENKLGLDQGYLGDKDTVSVYVKPGDIKNIRVPSGNEAGANGQWVPGGYTSGGVPEAVVDLSDTPFSEILIK
jgi:filamentous hemagglutinin